eukprot:scaffold489_cov309-Pavlova_lutheri.AAC.13
MGRVLRRFVQLVDAILHTEVAELCLIAPVLVDWQHGPWDVEARLLHIGERCNDECVGQFVVAFAFDQFIQLAERLVSIGLDFSHVLRHGECGFDAHVFPPGFRFGLASFGEHRPGHRGEHDPPGDPFFHPRLVTDASRFDRTLPGTVPFASPHLPALGFFREDALHQIKVRSLSAAMDASRSANGPGSATSDSQATASPTDRTRLSGRVSMVSTRRPFQVSKKASKGRRTVCHVSGGGASTACHRSGGEPGGAIQLSVRKLAM